MKAPSSFGYRFAAIVATIWGIAVVVGWTRSLGSSSSDGYSLGKFVGLCFGGLLLWGGYRWWQKANRLAAAFIPAAIAPGSELPGESTTVAAAPVATVKRGRIRNKIFVGLGVVALAIGSLMLWVQYDNYRFHKRQEQVLSFLVDEFVKKDKDGTFSYAYHKPCPSTFRDSDGKLATFDPCK